MTEPQFPRLDFDAFYRGESPAEGVPGTATVPWDTKAPKESVVGWHERGLVRGAVLDVGCGLGDNAIYLARQGFTVTGVDISATALITAERRAADAQAAIRFAVADATELAGYTDAFDTVVDSGMFHCLAPADRPRYAAAAHRATRSGATLLLSCFSDANPPDAERPLPGLTEAQVREVWDGPGWQVASLERTAVHREGWGGEMHFFSVQATRVPTR